MTQAAALERLRGHCLGLEGTEEVVKWGNDVVFQVGGKMYAVLGEWRGDLCLTVKVGKEAMGVFLEDARYVEAPYVGKHGWVSLRLGAEMEEEEVAELVRGSYELVTSPKRRSRQPGAGH
jgi:predicted DNA-binding protein (MmcQ/YjbR family)